MGKCHKALPAKARVTQDTALMLIRNPISILGLVSDRLLRLINCHSQKDVNFSKEDGTMLSKRSLPVENHRASVYQRKGSETVSQTREDRKASVSRSLVLRSFFDTPDRMIRSDNIDLVKRGMRLMPKRFDLSQCLTIGHGLEVIPLFSRHPSSR